MLIQIKGTKTYYVFNKAQNEKFEVKLPSDFVEHYLEFQKLVGTESIDKSNKYRYLGYMTLMIGFIIGLVLGGSLLSLSFERYNTFNLSVTIKVWVISFFAAMFWFLADDVLKVIRENNN